VPALPVQCTIWCEAQQRCLRFDLGNCRGISDRAESVGDPVGHKVRPATLRFEIADKRANGGITVTAPRHVMKVRAEQPIEKRVARGLVFRRRRFEPAVIDGKMAGKTELCRHGGNLPLAVRLHNAAGDDGIGAARNRLVQHVVELAQLVAAETEPGSIFSLDPQPRSAEMGRQSFHRLERGRQIGQTQTGKGSKPVGQ